MTDTHADADLDMDLSAAGDDWRPTPHGRFLARVLSQHDFARGKDVLELGAGVANHTILLLRQEPRSLVATEILPELLDSTRANVERNCGTDQPIEYRVADWLSTEGEFDLVVTNPPFCKSGKQNRRYFIDSLILDTHKRRRPGGELVFIQSSMADVQKTLARLDENGFDARVVEIRGTRSVTPGLEYAAQPPTLKKDELLLVAEWRDPNVYDQPSNFCNVGRRVEVTIGRGQAKAAGTQ